MSSLFLVSSILILTPNILLQCTSASSFVSFNPHNLEREGDGSFKPRDSEHYVKKEHDFEFDHEAILGSIREAEEFDKLLPEESKRRLAQIVPKMDLNLDQSVDRDELKKWILNSFSKLSHEEAQDRIYAINENGDQYITWDEYIADAFGVESEMDVGSEDTGDNGLLLLEEKEMWKAADSNGDGKLSFDEFEVFISPEDHPKMHIFLIKQILKEKDKNEDGAIDFQEYVGDRGEHEDEEWLIEEHDKFQRELDTDADGYLFNKEIKEWIIPNNEEIAEEEVQHLFELADVDGDNRLSYMEIIDNHQVFVGSANEFYGHDHFQDEL